MVGGGCAQASIFGATIAQPFPSLTTHKDVKCCVRPTRNAALALVPPSRCAGISRTPEIQVSRSCRDTQVLQHSGGLNTRQGKRDQSPWFPPLTPPRSLYIEAAVSLCHGYNRSERSRSCPEPGCHSDRLMPQS